MFMLVGKYQIGPFIHVFFLYCPNSYKIMDMCCYPQNYPTGYWNILHLILDIRQAFLKHLLLHEACPQVQDIWDERLTAGRFNAIFDGYIFVLKYLLRLGAKTRGYTLCQRTKSRRPPT